jgi:hypothetical protein
LSTTRTNGPSHSQLTYRALGNTLGLLLAMAPFAAAQATLTDKPAPDLVTANVRLDLPDSPSALFTYSNSSIGSSSSTDAAADTPAPTGISFDQATSNAAQTPTKPAKHAPHLQMTISPGEIADPMSVHDKVIGGIKDSASLFSMTGWFASAGWEQVTNGTPNYGTDSGAFGARLGAAAARGFSEGVFSESLFAPLFHEDPRYYIMGPGHNFFKRLIYAGTRSIITRTDSGRTTANFSLIAGNLAGSALTIPYYPQINTTFPQVMETFGGSLGGSALGYVVDEFIVDALIDLHIKKKQP